ncbi:6500_t:CDS:2, partial [Racocetra persica]
KIPNAKCFCSKCQPKGGKLLSWRTWRKHQRNKNTSHMFSIPKNSLSNSNRPISTSISREPITFNTLNYGDNENITDYLDNVNEINSFDNENEMNFDIAQIDEFEQNNIDRQQIGVHIIKQLPLDNLELAEYDSDFQSDHDSTSTPSEDHSDQ